MVTAAVDVRKQVLQAVVLDGGAGVLVEERLGGCVALGAAAARAAHPGGLALPSGAAPHPFRSPLGALAPPAGVGGRARRALSASARDARRRGCCAGG